MGKGESLEDLQAYYILLCIANMLTEISNSNAARFYTTETGRTSHNPGIFSAPPPGGTSTWPSWQWSFRSYPESQRTCPGSASAHKGHQMSTMTQKNSKPNRPIPLLMVTEKALQSFHVQISALPRLKQLWWFKFVHDKCIFYMICTYFERMTI